MIPNLAFADLDFWGSRVFGVGNGPYSVAIADLDGDTFLDLAVANVDDDNVTILINNSSLVGDDDDDDNDDDDDDDSGCCR